MGKGEGVRANLRVVGEGEGCRLQFAKGYSTEYNQETQIYSTRYKF